MWLGCVKKNWKFPTCYFRLVACAIKFKAVKIRILGKDAVISTKIWFILLFDVPNFRLQPTQNRSMKSIAVMWNVHKVSAKDSGYIRSLYLIAKLLFDKRQGLGSELQKCTTCKTWKESGETDFKYVTKNVDQKYQFIDMKMSVVLQCCTM